MQTPLTDGAVKATYDEADEMKFVLAIYGMDAIYGKNRDLLRRK